MNDAPPATIRLVQRGWKAWLVVVGVGILGILASAIHTRLTRQNDFLSRPSFDLAQRWRRPPPPRGVLVLEIDEKTRTNLGAPVVRSNYAILMDRAATRGAKLVFFDLVFIEPRSPGEDGAMSNRLRGLDIAVVGEALRRMPLDLGSVRAASPDVTDLDLVAATPSIPGFRREGHYGLLDFEPDSDGSIRRLYGAFRRSRHPDRLTAGWQAMKLVTDAPADPYRERWLRYYGPARGVFTHQSLADALTNAALPEETRFVFVGVNQGDRPASQIPEFRDQHRSPFGGAQLSGLEVQATATLNLIQDQWLSRLHPIAQGIVTVVWGTLLVAILAARKTLAMQLLVIALAVILSLVLLELGARLRFWWPWLIPVGAQTVAALVACAWLPDPPLGRPVVFISYSGPEKKPAGHRHGAAHARAIEEALRSRRIPAYFAPAEMRAGGKFAVELLRAIDEAPNFVLLLTPGAVTELLDASSWVRQEVDHAIATGRHIIVVRTVRGEELVGPLKSLALPDELAVLRAGHDVEFDPERNFDKSMTDLVGGLK